MGKHKNYSHYRPINDYWVDGLPSHWRYINLRWLARIYAGGTPDKKNDDYWFDGNIPWLASGEVNQWDVTVPTTYITEEAYANSSAKWIPKGGLIVALAGQGKTKGMAAQLQFPATCNQSLAAIVCRTIDCRFLLYWLHSSYKNLRWLAGGDLRDGLNLDLIGSVSVPMPSQAEQIDIAAFLDHETAKIDRLIAKQERLIELLKEKRQAVISHAVTKGLNPNAPMKDTGVEWLGEVPAHWAVAKVSHHYEVVLGKMLDEKRITGENSAPYLRNTDVQWDRINTDDLPVMDFSHVDRVKFELRKDDLLVCEGGEVGRAALWKGELLECYYQKALHRLRPLKADADLPRFMFYLLWQASEQGRFAGPAGKATIVHLPAEALRQYRFPFPPAIEQVGIVRYLDDKNSKMDLLIEKAQKSIELMQEHRTALISAAVTGKIDVRAWQKPNTESEETATAVNA